MTTDKVRENRVRRQARRLGYKLAKGRGYVANYSGKPYSLITADQSLHMGFNDVLLIGCSLGDVEAYLKREADHKAMA